MKTYILIASPIGSAKSPEWLACHSDARTIANAYDALSKAGAYGLEVRTVTNGVLGAPLTELALRSAYCLS